MLLFVQSLIPNPECSLSIFFVADENEMVEMKPDMMELGNGPWVKSPRTFVSLVLHVIHKCFETGDLKIRHQKIKRLNVVIDFPARSRSGKAPLKTSRPRLCRQILARNANTQF